MNYKKIFNVQYLNAKPLEELERLRGTIKTRLVSAAKISNYLKRTRALTKLHGEAVELDAAIKLKGKPSENGKDTSGDQSDLSVSGRSLLQRIRRPSGDRISTRDGGDNQINSA